MWWCVRVKLWKGEDACVCECVRYVRLGCVRGGAFLGELHRHSLKGQSTAGSRRPAPGVPTAFLAQHRLLQ